MKKLLSLLIFLHSPYIWAQVSDPNQGSFNAAFERPSDLTDQQASTAKNFIHQGIKDQKYKAGCARLNNCLEDSSFPVETLIAKAYGMLGLLGIGGKIELKPTDDQIKAAPKKEAQDKLKGEEKTDWCQVAATFNETLGGMIQSHMQQQAAQRAQAEFSRFDSQLASLQQLKETHKARRKTANWQSAAFGAITTCYAAYLIKLKTIKDPWKIYAKMGGAAALTYLFIRKADKHQKAMGIVDEVIASFPRSGECNPYTKTACFCAEKSSKEKYPSYYQEVCVLNAGNFDTPVTQTACGTMVDGKVTLDAACKCKVTNTCVTPQFGNIAGNFNFDSNVLRSPDQMLRNLYGGEFDEGKLRDYGLGTAAMASRIQTKGLKLPTPKLTEEQKKMAEALSEVMPRELAQIAAVSAPRTSPSLAVTAGSPPPHLSALSKEMKEKLGQAINVNYDQGSNLTQSVSEEGPTFEMPKMPGQEEATSSTEVVNFAEKAISKADVSKNPETPIFDIISNRYRRSGWTKLQTLTE